MRMSGKEWHNIPDIGKNANDGHLEECQVNGGRGTGRRSSGMFRHLNISCHVTSDM